MIQSEDGGALSQADINRGARELLSQIPAGMEALQPAMPQSVINNYKCGFVGSTRYILAFDPIHGREMCRLDVGVKEGK
jgi:hypothetical protein